MNYGHSNISNTLKENELHIISIIRSSRKNKLESPLNILLNDYHKEGNKRKIYRKVILLKIMII